MLAVGFARPWGGDLSIAVAHRVFGGVNKGHQRPTNEWEKKGPSERASLGVVKDKLKIRKCRYVPLRRIWSDDDESWSFVGVSAKCTRRLNTVEWGVSQLTTITLLIGFEDQCLQSTVV